MSLEWYDSVDDEDVFSEEKDASFYCPYTNKAECSILIKGLQPQELCLALECQQMKIVKRQSASCECHKAA